MQAESIMEPPHKIKLIVATAEKYLNIRYFSYQKFYIKEITNPVSKTDWIKQCNLIICSLIARKFETILKLPILTINFFLSKEILYWN